ncbi:cilia- and flagella-associated protein 91 [Alosa sapidissima]|uniref:cilia- and flagella-associated protein 91 n=1 Tax=Alosa sapidissima TaxID=34773 RepID=UPI001C091BC1|nr:cilia- and flagella-associated protein 91 [Alosa sapidissima]
MSVSVTQTFCKKDGGKKGYRPQRVHDYLYDPIYTVSGEMDHARVSFKSHASVDRVRKVPEFKSMFSHLPHHPRYTLRLESTDPVPEFIDRRWRGHADQRRQALQQLTGVIPGIQTEASDQQACNVSGADRWKFFKRPLIPFTQQVPADVVFAVPISTLFPLGGGQTDRAPTPFQRSVAMQTDYRDSEAQTEPYTPEYVLRPGTAPPELLTLATLTWGRGLPAGLAEVEMIERARVKRAWEATLPPLHDLAQLDKRRRMMEEMERKEWAFRESEIEKLQEARLALLMRLLRQREETQQQVTTRRLDQCFSQQQLTKEAHLRRIRNNYAISLRKLTEKRKNIEGKLERRDIVKDYSDYASPTYAPLSRVGVFPDRHSQRNVVRSQLLDTYEGLVQLEANMPSSVLEPRIKAPKPKVCKGFVKRADRREMELARTYKALKEEKERGEEKKPLRFLYKKEKPVDRPASPVVEAPPEGDEEKELAVILLQKLLRGRSIQNQMFEGKERRLELIQDLRTTHALQREEQELLKEEKHLMATLQTQRELHCNKVSQLEAYEAGVSGAVLVDMLDFLSKELVRLQEERRLHALTLLAERRRRMREAEESGRRQLEERRRREEDHIFKQVVKVHQDTVDLYLEDIILGTVEQTADAQAREEVQRLAEEVNNVAYAMEETRSVLQSEEIVAELVYSFLLPEIQKISVRDKVRQSQRRHLQAAHSIIHRGAEGSAAPTGPLRPLSPSDRASQHLLRDMVIQVDGTLSVPSTALTASNATLATTALADPSHDHTDNVLEEGHDAEETASHDEAKQEAEA